LAEKRGSRRISRLTGNTNGANSGSASKMDPRSWGKTLGHASVFPITSLSLRLIRRLFQELSSPKERQAIFRSIDSALFKTLQRQERNLRPGCTWEHKTIPLCFLQFLRVLGGSRWGIPNGQLNLPNFCYLRSRATFCCRLGCADRNIDSPLLGIRLLLI
jgi:hypothetical protein